MGFRSGITVQTTCLRDLVRMVAGRTYARESEFLSGCFVVEEAPFRILDVNGLFSASLKKILDIF